jgi:hypothetical protein
MLASEEKWTCEIPKKLEEFKPLEVALEAHWLGNTETNLAGAVIGVCRAQHHDTGDYSPDTGNRPKLPKPGMTASRWPQGLECDLNLFSVKWDFYIFFKFLFVCGTQGFMLAKEAFYHLSHTSSPFCCGYFGNGVSKTIYRGWPQTSFSRSQPPK